MAVTEYFVAPGGTDDEVGDRGTVIGNPWATPVFALDTGIYNIGQGGDGDQLNVAAGTYVSSKDHATTNYHTSFTTSFLKPFFFQGAGLTTTIFDGDDTYSIFDSSTYDGIHFSDLTARNTGTEYIIRFDAFSEIARCRLHGTTGIAACNLGRRSFLLDCEIYGCGGNYMVAIAGNDGGLIGNRLHDDSATPSDAAVLLSVSNSIMECNTIRLANPGSIEGVAFGGNQNTFIHNSIFANAGTGTGIRTNTLALCVGNVVEGFSGVGGIGIDGPTNGTHLAHNAVYNCTTKYSAAAAAVVYNFDNEELGATPFANAAGGDFTPVDVGNVWGGGWPTVGGSAPDKGAVQRLAGGNGGGGLRLVGAGGLIG